LLQGNVIAGIPPKSSLIWRIAIASLHVLFPHIATRNHVHPYNYGNVVYILHIVILANVVFF